MFICLYCCIHAHTDSSEKAASGLGGEGEGEERDVIFVSKSDSRSSSKPPAGRRAPRSCAFMDMLRLQDSGQAVMFLPPLDNGLHSSIGVLLVVV